MGGSKVLAAKHQSFSPWERSCRKSWGSRDAELPRGQEKGCLVDGWCCWKKPRLLLKPKSLVSESCLSPLRLVLSILLSAGHKEDEGCRDTALNADKNPTMPLGAALVGLKEAGISLLSVG